MSELYDEIKNLMFYWVLITTINQSSKASFNEFEIFLNISLHAQTLRKKVLNDGKNIIMICNKSFNLFGSPIGETKEIGYLYFGEEESQKFNICF